MYLKNSQRKICIGQGMVEVLELLCTFWEHYPPTWGYSPTLEAWWFSQSSIHATFLETEGWSWKFQPSDKGLVFWWPTLILKLICGLPRVSLLERKRLLSLLFITQTVPRVLGAVCQEQEQWVNFILWYHRYCLIVCINGTSSYHRVMVMCQSRLSFRRSCVNKA